MQRRMTLEVARVLNDEQRSIQRVVVHVRFVGALAFLLLAFANAYGAGQVDWAARIPAILTYAALALMQVLLFERFGRFLAMPAALIDALLAWNVQWQALPLSDTPAGVAGFSLGLFAALVVLSGLSLETRVVAVSFVAGSTAQVALMRAVPLPVGAWAAAVLVLAIVGALIITITQRLRLLAVSVAEREVQRRVAEEQQKAAEFEKHMAATHLAESQVQNERLEDLQRDKEKLMHLIVHDLRAPLTGIIGALDLLDDSMARGDGDVKQSLGVALATAARLNDMIDDLLVIAKLEEGKMHAVRASTPLPPLFEQVRTTAAPIATQRGIVLSHHCDGALAPPVDSKLLQRLLDNLVANAMRYTPSGGRVRIEARRDGQSAWLAVHNDGQPIPPEGRVRLFQKFEQGASRSGGFGLGLYLCRLVAEAHDGAIAIEDVPGWSCSFVVRLPAAAAGS